MRDSILEDLSDPGQVAETQTQAQAKTEALHGGNTHTQPSELSHRRDDLISSSASFIIHFGYRDLDSKLVDENLPPEQGERKWNSYMN